MSIRLKYFYIYISIIVFLLYTNSYSQNNYDIKQFGDETIEFLKQPANWDGSDFLTLALISAGTYGLMHIDESVRSEMLKDRSHVDGIPLEFGRYWGEPITTVLLSAALYMHGLMADNQSTKKLGYEIGQSYIYTLAVTGVFKIGFGRARPLTGKSAFYFRPFQSMNYENWSLPSGHSSIGFSLSTILSRNAKTDFLKILAYLPPVITAFSRVYYNKHWTSDVFLGAVVGYFIGTFVADLHKENEELMPENITHQPLFSISLSF